MRCQVAAEGGGAKALCGVVVEKTGDSCTLLARADQWPQECRPQAVSCGGTQVVVIRGKAKDLKVIPKPADDSVPPWRELMKTFVGIEPSDAFISASETEADGEVASLRAELEQ